MAMVPTSEEAARAILSFLKLKDVHPNEMIMASQVNQEFLTNKGKVAVYAEGIKYAIERGWLEPLTKDRFRLTETGFIEMGRRRAAELASDVSLTGGQPRPRI
jgi:hypothetical protein